MRANGSRPTSASSSGAKASSARSSRTVGGGADLLVPRILDDPDEQPVEREVLDAPPRELDVADVRRVERAAEDSDG